MLQNTFEEFELQTKSSAVKQTGDDAEKTSEDKSNESKDSNIRGGSEDEAALGKRATASFVADVEGRAENGQTSDEEERSEDEADDCGDENTVQRNDVGTTVVKILDSAENNGSEGAEPVESADSVKARAELFVVVAVRFASGVDLEDGEIGGKAGHALAFLEETESVALGDVGKELRDEGGEQRGDENQKRHATRPLIQVEDLHRSVYSWWRGFGLLGFKVAQTVLTENS